MRLHRFYIDPRATELRHQFWLHDGRLLHQWRNVLRMNAGQEVILFDGQETERLYRISELNEREAHLELVTDYVRKLPKREIYLGFALLKKDKNDWVLQKGTELGVRHFVPLLAERSEKTGFNLERAEKILIEAAEQCGRSDIPTVREPLHIGKLLDDLQGTPAYVGEAGGQDPATLQEKSLAMLIGPEGGWSDAERSLFEERGLKHIALGDFTLRSETAAIAAVAALMK